MNKIIRSYRQTLLDIAIQYCGDATAAFEIAVINDIELTDMDRQELLIPAAYNARIVDYYRNNSLSPATSLDEQEEVPKGTYVVTVASRYIVTQNEQYLTK